MDIDPSGAEPLKQKAEELHRLATGPLSSSISKLSYTSRAVPSEKDFHFFYNFVEFKAPMKAITERSQSMLETVGSSAHVWGKAVPFPRDLDDAYDWLVDVNDELFEWFDASMDEFQMARKREEESARMPEHSDSGFQLVYGKKKKGMIQREKLAGGDAIEGGSVVKVASKDKNVAGAKPRIPFHIRTIPRPQDEFNILVNNSNQSFEHVWLQKNEDGSRFVHPLENLSVLDFVDRNVEPIKPQPLESMAFNLVEEVKDLKELAAKLRSVSEFAVDLEHNQYRSFQGLTCLMQISTRTEDFVVDTLKLRIHIGPHLREVFKDPTKKKVMHGADRDVGWLQRDFGIYICNLFDTGQASRVLKMERNSLEYLLHHFCGVTADKEYQNADWRLRPLPDEMLKYAREDTHYLLHIYDLLRIRLLSMSECENSDPLVEVYKRSYDLCMQLYEKELFTERSYLHIYGLQGADLNAQQLAVVAGLCEWRDIVARAEDESTGYILPNRTLLEIAKQMPLTASKLRRLLRSKHPYVDSNLGSVVGIIRHSIQNDSAFQAAAEHLKKGRVETHSEETMVDPNGFEAMQPETSSSFGSANGSRESACDGNIMSSALPVGAHISVRLKDECLEIGSSTTEHNRDGQGGSHEQPAENGRVKIENDICIPEHPGDGITISGQNRKSDIEMSMPPSVKVGAATVKVLKKPASAFGALFGKTVPKKFDTCKKEEIKLEQIKSSVNLPFYLISPRDEQIELVVEEPANISDILLPEEPHCVPVTGSSLEDIIPLEANSDVKKLGNVDSDALNPSSEKLGNVDSDALNPSSEHRDGNAQEFASDFDQGDGPMSLSDLSSNFQKCFQSMNKNIASKQVEKSQESYGLSFLKPFDYEAARKQVKFGERFDKKFVVDSNGGGTSQLDSGGRKKSSGLGQVHRDEGTRDFQQGKRRQAFPASGNRSATFR